MPHVYYSYDALNQGRMNINYWVNRRIAFTKSWRYTFLIGIILGGVLAALLILLQPFDTYEHQSPTKNLELAGYAPLLLIAVLSIHFLEKWTYRIQRNQWRMWNEALILMLGSLWMLGFCYVYNSWVINQVEIGWLYYGQWMWYNGSPFLIFLMPIWLYIRSRFGTIEKEEATREKTPVTVIGQNKSEQLRILPQNFIYAQAQQNYADIFYSKEEGQIEKKCSELP